jgi:hypothetical protein
MRIPKSQHEKPSFIEETNSRLGLDSVRRMDGTQLSKQKLLTRLDELRLLHKFELDFGSVPCPQHLAFLD